MNGVKMRLDSGLNWYELNSLIGMEWSGWNRKESRGGSRDD